MGGATEMKFGTVVA